MLGTPAFQDAATRRRRSQRAAAKEVPAEEEAEIQLDPAADGILLRGCESVKGSVCDAVVEGLARLL